MPKTWTGGRRSRGEHGRGRRAVVTGHLSRRRRSPCVDLAWHARRAGRRAHHRRGAPLQPPPDHPRRGHDRAEAAEERQGARHRRRRPRLARAALPGRGRRRHARHRGVRHGRRVQPAAPGHPRRSATSTSPRAESAKESIAEVNPYVEVVLHDERLDNDNVLQVFEGYDLIVDGTDNFATRYMVNDAAYFLKIPYVWGSIYRFDGQASVFAPMLGRATCRATAASTPSPRRRAWSPAAPRAACWACCAPASARSRSTRRSS